MTTFDPKKPVATRDGRIAFIDAADAKFPTGQTLLGRIRGLSGEDMSYKWFEDGRALTDENSDDDLVNIEPLVSRWINIYDETGELVVHLSRAQAASSAGSGRIGVMELIFKGGRLVDHVYHEV